MRKRTGARAASATAIRLSWALTSPRREPQRTRTTPAPAKYGRCALHASPRRPRSAAPLLPSRGWRWATRLVASLIAVFHAGPAKPRQAQRQRRPEMLNCQSSQPKASVPGALPPATRQPVRAATTSQTAGRSGSSQPMTPPIHSRTCQTAGNRSGTRMAPGRFSGCSGIGPSAVTADAKTRSKSSLAELAFPRFTAQMQQAFHRHPPCAKKSGRSQRGCADAGTALTGGLIAWARWRRQQGFQAAICRDARTSFAAKKTAALRCGDRRCRGLSHPASLP